MGKAVGGLIAKGAKGVADSDILTNLVRAGDDFATSPAGQRLGAVTGTLARPVLTLGETSALGAAQGIAGAPSGSEGQGALNGLGTGVLAAPVALALSTARRVAPVAPATAAALRAKAVAAATRGSTPAAAPTVSPARAVAFDVLTRGADRINPADANVRLDGAAAAGVPDVVGDLLLFTRHGQKRAPEPAPADAGAQP